MVQSEKENLEDCTINRQDRSSSTFDVPTRDAQLARSLSVAFSLYRFILATLCHCLAKCRSMSDGLTSLEELVRHSRMRLPRSSPARAF